LTGTGRKALFVLWDTELEIPFFAPVWSPGVADLPEFRALILVVLSVFAIANEGNGMIDFSDIGETAFAIGLSDHT